MAGYIIIPSANLRAPTGYVSNTADSSFPNTNIGNRYPNRPWKSSGNVASGTTYVGVDFGSAVSVAAIFIDKINIAAIKIQAASDTGFSTSLLDSGAIGAGKSDVDQRYKRFYDTTGTVFDGQTRRYWRILANTSTTITGAAGKMSVGSVCWASGYVTWPHGTGDYDELPIEPTRPNDNFDGGGSEPIIIGNQYAAITLGQSVASRADMRVPILSLLSEEGIARWWVFFPNKGDTSEAYRVRRAVDTSLRTTGPNSITFQGLTLEEST
jgi:hypothetical protein